MTLLSFVSVFLLVFGRLVGFLVAAPLFSSKQLPAQHKLAIAAGLAYFASYAVKTTVQVDDIDFFFRMGTEVIIGLALGLLASFLLYAPQIAGSIIDLQMGLAMASAYDPMFGGQSPIVGRFFYMLTLLVLLASDMHLILLDGIYTSFKIFPPGSAINVSGEAGMSLVVRVVGLAMLTALQMAMPLSGRLVFSRFGAWIFSENRTPVQYFCDWIFRQAIDGLCDFVFTRRSDHYRDFSICSLITRSIVRCDSITRRLRWKNIH